MRIFSLPALLILVLGCLATGCATSGTKTSAKEFRDCADCPAMLTVKRGEFLMGFDGGEPERYEGPVRKVRIAKDFALGKYEVTNGEYRKFVAATGHVSGKGCFALNDGTYKQLPGTDWSDPGYGRPIRDDEPVACVQWNDAKAYVAWLAERTGKRYRLPSEAEWEFAARAGRDTGRFVWGDKSEQACRESNVFDASGARAIQDRRIAVAPCDDGLPGVAPVGSRAPNPFGLYDMIGNVWEWVEDCYAMPHPADAPTDGSAQTKVGCDRRGSKGGSWVTTLTRQTPTFRGRDPATLTSQIFGFRIARDL